MSFNCPTCGQQGYALIDGYAFGDRLLEDVEFEIRKDKDGNLTASVEPSAANYFSQLNEKKWLKEAVKRATDCPDELTCPQCGQQGIT